MAGVCLGAVSAHATDGTWLATPATNDWTTGTNWTSSPVVPNGTATFGQSTQASITFNASTGIQTIQFTAGASSFSFALPTTSLNIGGTGIVLDPASPAPTFAVSTDGQLLFLNGATASNSAVVQSPQPTFAATGANIINNDTGRTGFAQNSTAGFAFIQNNDNPFGKGTLFGDSSKAGFAYIKNSNSAIGGGTTFGDHSNAGNANIENIDLGQTLFQGQSRGGNARIFNHQSINGGSPGVKARPILPTSETPAGSRSLTAQAQLAVPPSLTADSAPWRATALRNFAARPRPVTP